jgi:hypothetical protein
MLQATTGLIHRRTICIHASIRSDWRQAAPKTTRPTPPGGHNAETAHTPTTQTVTPALNGLYNDFNPHLKTAQTTAQNHPKTPDSPQKLIILETTAQPHPNSSTTPITATTYKIPHQKNRFSFF